MSWCTVERPSRWRVPGGSAGVAAMLVALAAVTLAFASFLHVQVTVDGQAVTIPAGSTVEALVATDEVGGSPGDLLALDGETVLRRGGGDPPSAWMQGSEVASETVLVGGERITTRDGADRIEEIVRSERLIPIPVVVTGTGPILQLASTGAPGLTVVRRGKVSGTVVATETVQEPTPMTVVRTTPASVAGKKLVALTFDDGPWPESTDALLDLLEKEDVKATFFVVGSRVARQPKTARRIVAEGHVIANHTLGHRKLEGAGVKVVRKQIRDGADRIKSVTGVRPRWFRPPGGALNSTILDEARRVDEQLVLWSVDPQDWRRPGWKQIAARVVNVTKSGDVVLLHDGGGDRAQTVHAVKRIIERLRAKGFEFVTLDELAGKTDVKAVRR